MNCELCLIQSLDEDVVQEVNNLLGMTRVSYLEPKKNADSDHSRLKYEGYYGVINDTHSLLYSFQPVTLCTQISEVLFSN